jgi:hypothetical protein
MTFDPDTGTLYVGEGSATATRPHNLYTLDPSTGALALVGPLGAQAGVSGLVFVPEPSLWFLLRFRRCCCSVAGGASEW